MKENGAVSIYAIIVILFVFLFNAVLIDFVRIMVAEYQTEIASKEAVRSAFGQYDQDVQDKGLFAISPDGEDPDAVFEKVFKENLAVEDDDYFRFVDTKMEEANLVPDENRSFANKNIMEYQMLEDMKYKAPIEFGEMIVDSILPYTCTMRDATVVNDIADEVQDKAEDRDEKINEAIDHIINIQERFEGTDSSVNGSGSADDYPIAKNLEDIREQNEEYHDDDEDNPTYVMNSKNVIQGIKSDAKYAFEEMAKAEVALEKAEKANKNLGESIDEAEEDAAENYEDIKTDQCSEAKVGDAEEELEEIQGQLKQYYIDPEESDFFSIATEKLSDAKYSINGDTLDSKTLFPFVKYQLDDWDHMLDEENIKPVINIMQERFDIASDDVDDARKYVDENYEEMPSDGSDDSSLSEAFEAMNKIKEILGKGKAIGKDFEAYASLETLINQYEGTIADHDEGLDLEDPQDSADGFLDKIMNIFSAMTKMGENMRNEAYVNEYILTRFSTNQKMDILNPSNIPETFLLKNREVEYILYGQHTPGANYALALGELAGVRFALNFVAAFTKRQVQIVVLPLPKVLAAISWAFQRTVTDLKNVTSDKKKDPPFLNITGVKTFRPDYTFYLRLFLFLHPDKEDQRITRMQALIDYNKDKSADSVLKDAPTYASATAESSVDLWFLPSLIEMFDKANVLEGKVENGRYHIKKEVDYSY